ncbi:phosphoribosylglycinamide formyltransferase [Corynebacterium heidelbergense]|uniref:phosphoribosylglycinamide formyltransferase n=1 Tax=Corynebacterium heidelbergense TaxID=2055947 RepID=UPI0026A33D72
MTDTHRPQFPPLRPREGEPLSVVVLASGSGTLLQALIDHFHPAHHGPTQAPVRICGVGSDRECLALHRAEAAGIPTFVVPYLPGTTNRSEWNQHLRTALGRFAPDLVVSAGFMRILGPEVLADYAGRIINTHPALLPAFPGAHAVADALDYGVKVTGSTVHLIDAGVDTGPILAQRAVPVYETDRVDVLHERIKTVERELLVHTLQAIAEHGITLDGRKARIPDNVTKPSR